MIRELINSKTICDICLLSKHDTEVMNKFNYGPYQIRDVLHFYRNGLQFRRLLDWFHVGLKSSINFFTQIVTKQRLNNYRKKTKKGKLIWHTKKQQKTSFNECNLVSPALSVGKNNSIFFLHSFNKLLLALSLSPPHLKR